MSAAGTHAGNGGAGAESSGQGAVGGASATGGGSGSASSGGAGHGGTAGSGSGGLSGEGGIDGGASDAGLDSSIAEGVCVVATRIDECCPSWQPVPRGEALQDPCLVAIGERLPFDSAAQSCLPPFCPEGFCPQALQPSQLAEPSGADGECVFVDECRAESDCVLAIDDGKCCPCPQNLPAPLVEREPCLRDATEAWQSLDECSIPCPLIACPECPAPTAPVCSIGDALSACQ
jgi:hypothetical protein